MSKPKTLPNDFDTALVADDSRLPADALSALRELVWRKCESDPLWFLTEFWWCMDPRTFKWSRFDLRPYQVEDGLWMVEAMRQERQRRLVLKARQIGWTTLGSGLAFHDCFFNENHPWLIASQREIDAVDTLRNKIKAPYARLPLWLRNYAKAPEITDDNAERMSFSNGSSILSVPATGSAGRSRAVYGALLDEFAFVQEAEALLGAIDPLTYGPLVVFSTANGMGNAFHSLWVEGQAHDAEWEARFRPWNVVPGRDEKWYQREQRKYRGREWLFFQEYPSDPEEAFAKSGRTVLPIDVLRSSGSLVEPTWKVDLGTFPRSEPLTLKRLEGLEPNPYGAAEELWVWGAPTVEYDDRDRLIRKPNYVIGCDVAEGLEHGDRTSITIADANYGEQVASYMGHWPLEDLGEMLEWLGYSYHTALILVERNNHGILPLDYLRRARYPRLYRMATVAQIQQGDRTPRYGFITTRGTKPKLVTDLIKAIVDDSFRIHDTRFLQEAMVFVADGKGGYSASEGNHDDHVMSHGIANQGLLEVGQYPPIFHDDSVRPFTMGDIARFMDEAKVKPNPLDLGIGQRPVRKPAPSFVR